MKHLATYFSALAAISLFMTVPVGFFAIWQTEPNQIRWLLTLVGINYISRLIAGAAGVMHIQAERNELHQRALRRHQGWQE